MTQKPKHAGGRPTKFSPVIQEKIVTALRSGAYIETAAVYAGINKDTLYAWLKKGARAKNRKSIYSQFSDAVEKAQAEAEMRDVAVISKSANSGHWQASAWRLERKFPARWGRRDAKEHSGEVKIRVVYEDTEDGDPEAKDNE
jgi:transposase